MQASPEPSGFVLVSFINKTSSLSYFNIRIVYEKGETKRYKIKSTSAAEVNEYYSPCREINQHSGSHLVQITRQLPEKYNHWFGCWCFA